MSQKWPIYADDLHAEDANKEEKSLYEEMRRVAQTVLLAMRSEWDLMATLQEEPE